LPPTTSTALDLLQITERYFAAWEANDPDQIVALHSEDTQFQLHVGSTPVVGRDAVRQTFAEIFEQWPGFSFESRRVLFGKDHWVLDWDLLAKLPNDDGTSRDVRLHCLDVVAIDNQGLVKQKDTFVDAGQLQEVLPAE
jgi:ketosteroid isomerase-like protein